MKILRHARWWGVLWLGLAIVFASGCDSGDEFAGAPRAEAPDEPLAESQAPRRPAKRARSNQEGGSLPADHPPIGGSQGAQDGPEQGESAPAAKPGASANLPVDWKAPESWKKVRPSSSMRKAQYQLAGADDAAPATLAVFFFGSRGGGSIQANIDRWVGQFKQPGGGSAREAAEITEKSVNGMTVHLVDVTGTYSPGTGMGGGGAKKDHRMLAAIAETGGGSVFFKLVGPSATVAAHESEFATFVDSFQSTR